MGMAASQARYLELTARKTNVEYEGQQINQQRVALANQSAGLFSQLMSLQVPTPPSTQDYTSIEYTFNDGVNLDTITNVQNLTGNPNYNATVSYQYTEKAYQGYEKIRSDLGVQSPSGVYWLTNGAPGGSAIPITKLTHCSTTDPDYQSDVQALTQIVADLPNSSMGTTFDPGNPTSTIGDVWKYTANGVTHYYTVTDLANMNPNGEAGTLSSYYAADVDKTVTKTENAYITRSESGRYSTLELESFPGSTFNLAASSVTDDNAYNDAMNEYTYQQALYQKTVEDINAKTEVIEVEDRTLEVKLKQLDTEQEALQTEMEAVKKVIDKNIEQTFKTFN